MTELVYLNHKIGVSLEQRRPNSRTTNIRELETYIRIANRKGGRLLKNVCVPAPSKTKKEKQFESAT